MKLLEPIIILDGHPQNQFAMCAGREFFTYSGKSLIDCAADHRHNSFNSVTYRFPVTVCQVSGNVFKSRAGYELSIVSQEVVTLLETFSYLPSKGRKEEQNGL